MQKLIFERHKYGREFLFDAVDTANFGVKISENIVLPTFYTIACLHKSTGELKVASQSITLQNQMLFFIAEGQHTEISQAVFEEGFFLFFEKEFLDLFFKENNFIYKFSFFHNPNHPQFLHLQPADFLYCYQLFQDIYQEMQTLKKDSEHLIRSLLYHLLIKANRFYAHHHQFSDGNLLSREALIRFRSLLETHIRELHKVREYATILGISRVYLNKLCVDFFAKTATQLIKERLMVEAKKELLYTSKTIAEIAYDLNFADPPNFSRFFKQMTTHTPQQFRELNV